MTITVVDGKNVELGIASPKSGSTLVLNRKPKKATRSKKTGKLKRRKIPSARIFKASGTAADASGVKLVQVALRLTSRSRIHKLLKPAFSRRDRLRAGKKRGCEHYIGARASSGAPCDEGHVLEEAACPRVVWTFSTRKKLRLPPGRYELVVRATDSTNLVQRAAAKDDTIIKFRVR